MISRKFPSRLSLLPLFLLPLISTGQNQADTTTTTPPPAKLDLTAFPGAMVDKVVVPVPAEIFSVLDKLDEPDWSSEIKLPDSNSAGSDRVRLALVFGGTVAEGFIAVQAEEGAKVQDVGRRVLRLAGSLGLQKAVVPHCQSIIDAAGDEDWKTVREELDKTQQRVRGEMEQLRDGDLATLVSLGGWIRGTLALTSLISQSYSTDKAELLNQPDLVRHFRDSVGDMKNTVKEQADVAEISSGLTEILAALAENKNGNDEIIVIPANTVLRVGNICGTLLDRFYFEKKAGSNSESPNP